MARQGGRTRGLEVAILRPQDPPAAGRTLGASSLARTGPVWSSSAEFW